MQSTKDFYKDLPIVEDFNQTFQSSLNILIPQDWYVLVSDVKNSTKAIEDRKYKDVNMVGALSIIAMLNLDKQLELPFVFGGDGAFILIPSELLELSKQVLLNVQKIALQSYALELRVGIVPVSDIYEQGKNLFILKYKVSEDYTQAFIKGGGLELSDAMVKQDEKYLVKGSIDPDFEIDIGGLECRWEAIPTPKEETLSILIKAHNEEDYDEVLKNLQTILGTKVQRDPISQKKMKLSFKSKDLKTEAALYSQNIFVQHLIIVKFMLINILGKIFMDFKIKEWGFYKKRIQSTTDAEKFDDMLRLVVASTSKQRERLHLYLEKELQKKKLFFGIHSSDASLMTCLIFQRHGKHIHFVDSSLGGYALAAKMLKKQMQSAT